MLCLPLTYPLPIPTSLLPCRVVIVAAKRCAFNCSPRSSFGPGIVSIFSTKCLRSCESQRLLVAQIVVVITPCCCCCCYCFSLFDCLFCNNLETFAECVLLLLWRALLLGLWQGGSQRGAGATAAGKRIACRVCSLQLAAKVYVQQHNSHNSQGVVVYCLSLWTENVAYTWYNFEVSQHFWKAYFGSKLLAEQ